MLKWIKLKAGHYRTADGQFEVEKSEYGRCWSLREREKGVGRFLSLAITKQAVEAFRASRAAKVLGELAEIHAIRAALYAGSDLTAVGTREHYGLDLDDPYAAHGAQIRIDEEH